MLTRNHYGIFHEIMMEISHSNVRYATTLVLIIMLHWSIKKMSRSNVNFLTTDFVKSVTGKLAYCNSS